MKMFSWFRPDLTARRGSAGDYMVYVAVILAACSLRVLWPPAELVDDAFIYLQVARNLVTGNGWSFNAGEVMNPCSGPLYAIMLTLPLALGIPGELALWLTYWSGAALAALLLFHMLRPLDIRLALAGSFTWLLLPTLTKAAGMETTWFVAFLLAAIQAFCAGRPVLSGFCTSAALLLRPEGLLLVPILAIHWYLHGRRNGLKYLVPLVVVIGLWAVFSQLQFGSPIPHSVRVKSMQSRTGAFAHLPSFFGMFFRLWETPWITATVALLGIGYCVRATIRHGTFAASLMLAYAALQFTAYSVARAPFGYFWYYAPAQVALNVLVLAGALMVMLPLGRLLPARLRSYTLCANLAAALLLAAFACRFGAESYPGRLRAANCGSQYRLVGQWLRKNSPAGSRVAAVEIGYLGFFSERPILDIHGLIHPEHMADILQGHPDWWLHKDVADYVVVHDPPWASEPNAQPSHWPPESYRRFCQVYDALVKTPELCVYGRRVPSSQ